MKSCANPMNDAFPFVKDAVRRQPSNADPFQAWIELTEVVEALCPGWPERPVMSGGDFRL